MPANTFKEKKILVTGATGYVGSRLVPRLLAEGYNIRATSRSFEKLAGRKWANHPNVEIVSMSAQDPTSVKQAVAGCSVVYYLIHSMNSDNKDFAGADREAAKHMIAAAEEFAVERLIYLSGLGEESNSLSKHLRSRSEVANILQSSTVPTTVLRAAMIIGSGSASFEILRYLVNRLPIMITPKWVSTPSQPIAIRNVLNYLIGCLTCEQSKGRTFDIGGPDILSYKELMELYAQEANLPPRFIFPVPVFTPRLSSYWIHLVTPVPAYIAMPLAEGLRNPAICTENTLHELIPQELLTCRQAIRLSLNKLQHHDIESHWSDAGIIKPIEWISSTDPTWAGGTVFEDKRKMVVKCPAKNIWDRIIALGGQTGYYYGDWLWRLRGVMDKLFGGVGLRRGRRHPVEISVGDALDFWRVIAIEPEEFLLLVAEMKVPGTATLAFRLRSIDQYTTEVTQIARFVPAGLEGILYWYSLYPLHNLIFNGMLKGIAQSGKINIISTGKTK